ncbi:MAG: methyltransferase [Candidatus Aenigmatarchaeota archaeon]
MPKCFYKDIRLEMPEGVYEPAEDSVLAADYLAGLRPKKALDMGSGSGILAIVLAKNGADVTAVDIDPLAVEATARNAEANGVKVKVAESDLFRNVKGKFDLIVFNAPYIREKRGEGNKAWAGGEGLEIIRRFIAGAPKHLEKGGYIMLVISSLTGQDEVMGMLGKTGLKAGVVAEKKVAWEKLLLVEARF